VHPELLRALAKTRHADFLRDQEFRESRADRSTSRARVPGTSIGRVRRTVGAALVSAGTSLLGDNRPNIDLLNGPR
jgi:hypothetical protein